MAGADGEEGIAARQKNLGAFVDAPIATLHVPDGEESKPNAKSGRKSR